MGYSYIGPTMRRKIRTHYRDHTTAMTAAKFNVSESSVRKIINTPPEIQGRGIKARIVKGVCSHFNLTEPELFSVTRNRYIVTARQICFYLLRIYGKMTLTSIASLTFQHHATVIHSIDIVTGFISVKAPQADHVNTIVNKYL